MVAIFNSNPSATIISCYSPTNVSEETDLIAFYDELSSLVRSIPKHNVLVISGDMNAQIGKNVNHKFAFRFLLPLRKFKFYIHKCFRYVFQAMIGKYRGFMGVTDFMILKSLPVHRSCQHIIGILPVSSL